MCSVISRKGNWQPAHRQNNTTPTPSTADKIEEFEFKDWIVELFTDSRLSPERTTLLLQGPLSPLQNILAIISECERQKSVTLRMIRLFTRSCTTAVKESEHYVSSCSVEEADLLITLLGKRSPVVLFQ